jgi:hypothetical protein
MPQRILLIAMHTCIAVLSCAGTQDFAEPGNGDFPLGGFVKPAESKEEQTKWKAYFKDLRQEMCKVRQRRHTDKPFVYLLLHA